jgi:hypothetical protein
MRQQTSVINAIRAHLAEFGVVAPVERNGVETHSRALIEAEYMPPRKALDYRVYPVRRITSTLGLWYPMVRISRTCLSEHPNT